MTTRRNRGKWQRRLALSASLMLLAPGAATAQHNDAAAHHTDDLHYGEAHADEPAMGMGGDEDLLDLSLEELMDIKVTSVAKKAQKLSETAAAVYVITQEDIRRSGVTSIPEALRMVPGVQVARLDANKWAITARGFNRRFANKLLVLMDGRTLYTPLFSGVFWEVQGTMLEDVERIEVIRGPGATLWGANAVNGVINIITKKASDTQGGLLTAGAGTEEKGFGGVRYGGKTGENTWYRGYVKYTARDSQAESDGDDSADDWRIDRGGFRIDSNITDQDSLTITGDIYEGETGETVTISTVTPPYAASIRQDNNVKGHSLTSRWNRHLNDTADVSLQFFYDHNVRENPLLVGTDTRDIYDLEFQHAFSPSTRHAIVWGVGHRVMDDTIAGTENMQFLRNSFRDHLTNAFIQDDITLRPDKLRLTVGTKVEHYNELGTEIQPNARLLWTINPRHSLWASVSRAVRTPSRAERGFQVNARTVPPGSASNPTPWPVLVRVVSGDDVPNETLIAWEAGYRLEVTRSFSADVAVFMNEYEDLRTNESQPMTCASTGNPPPCPMGDYLILPRKVDSKAAGDVYGLEVAANIDIQSWWRVSSSYTYLNLDLDIESSSTDTLNVQFEGSSPHHQMSMRSAMDLSRSVELDVWLRHMGELPESNIDSYTTMDLRVGWLPRDDLTLSLVGQNLLDSQHQEFTPDVINTLATEIERSYYGKATWRF